MTHNSEIHNGELLLFDSGQGAGKFLQSKGPAFPIEDAYRQAAAELLEGGGHAELAALFRAYRLEIRAVKGFFSGLLDPAHAVIKALTKPPEVVGYELRLMVRGKQLASMQEANWARPDFGTMCTVLHQIGMPPGQIIERTPGEDFPVVRVVAVLDLSAEARPSLQSNQTSDRSTSSRVFLVHGHNDGLKEQVARFLERLGLEVTILHEQPDSGRALIEKFERHSEDVGFAVVLLTADDEGRAKRDSGDLKSRARQNVILEQGYFIGRLGRDRVCPLREEGVEVPSDLSGVLYTPVDAGGAWKTKLAQEIKAAGIEVDLNKIR